MLTRLQSFDDLKASEFAATQVVPTAGTHSDARAAVALHPSSARFVASPRIGYASRPNRAIDDRGLPRPRSAALLAAPMLPSLPPTEPDAPISGIRFLAGEPLSLLSVVVSCTGLQGPRSPPVSRQRSSPRDASLSSIGSRRDQFPDVISTMKALRLPGHVSPVTYWFRFQGPRYLRDSYLAACAPRGVEDAYRARILFFSR
jgi:hypothetical protein